MKKIAFISSGYLPIPSVCGGAVETLIDLLVNDKNLNKKYKIDVYSIYNEKAVIESKNNSNVNYFYINRKKNVLKYLRGIINKIGIKYIGNDFISTLVKEHKEKLFSYDYVIVENKPEFGLYLKKYIKGQLIFHSHNDFLNKKTKHAKEILKSYDSIFCLSKYICNRIQEIDQHSNNKIKLLYNGIDNEKFKLSNNEKSKLRAKYKLADNDFVFLYTGRLVKEKGVKELIKAFNNIKDKRYKLLISGSIGYGKNTKNSFTNELYELSKNNKNIIFTGYVEYLEMPNIYNLADCGIIPSTWEEPFALTVIEHLASGHPVIITESGAMPELVTRECSIIVKKDEKLIVGELTRAMKKIHSLINNKKTSEICIEQSKKFSKEKYINTFEKLVEEI